MDEGTIKVLITMCCYMAVVIESDLYSQKERIKTLKTTSWEEDRSAPGSPL